MLEQASGIKICGLSALINELLGLALQTKPNSEHWNLLK
jgi:hypothetical protein